MAIKTVCDGCNKEILNYEKVGILGSKKVSYADYCEDCWLDPKNWKQIHKSKKSE